MAGTLLHSETVNLASPTTNLHYLHLLALSQVKSILLTLMDLVTQPGMLTQIIRWVKDI
jgi:hypothetical protein